MDPLPSYRWTGVKRLSYSLNRGACPNSPLMCRRFVILPRVHVQLVRVVFGELQSPDHFHSAVSSFRRSEGIPPQGLSQSSFSVTKICVSPAGGVIHNGVGVHGVARGWRGVMEQRQTADENCGHTATADAVPPSPLPRFQFTVCYVSGDATPFISFLVLLIS
jgi:hypothetical protein